ncbi:MAG TPA: hypothetical protein VM716_08030 [Gemmatimonadales bacterium]|nr:hypothetical protein [Gemmatimonadales bacterium]
MRVYLGTGDLLFRSKLEAVVRAGRAEVSRDEATCDLAVVELHGPEAGARIATLVRSGVPVLAYGSHVRPDLLTAARAAGATAVPNSQVVERLAGMLNP